MTSYILRSVNTHSVLRSHLRAVLLVMATITLTKKKDFPQALLLISLSLPFVFSFAFKKINYYIKLHSLNFKLL